MPMYTLWCLWRLKPRVESGTSATVSCTIEESPGGELFVLVTTADRVLVKEGCASLEEATVRGGILREQMFPCWAEVAESGTGSTEEQRIAWWNSLTAAEREQARARTSAADGAEVGRLYPWAHMPFRHGKFKKG
jgi:hypothetical protein